VSRPALGHPQAPVQGEVSKRKATSDQKKKKTQQSGQSPDKEIKNRNHYIVYVGGYTEPDPIGGFSSNDSRLSGPTIYWFFLADSLARHLVQLAYDLKNAGALEKKTYPLELVRDVLPLWDPKDEKYHNRDLKPIRWDEIREKLNVTGKNWDRNTNVLQ